MDFIKILSEYIAKGNASSIIVGLFFGVGVFLLLIKLIAVLKENGIINNTPSSKVTITDIKEQTVDIKQRVDDSKINTEKNLVRLEDSIKDIENQLENIKRDLSKVIHYHSNISDTISSISNIILDIERKQNVDAEKIINLAKEFERYTRDNKDKHSEMHHSINDINQSLASLHGSILAINGSDRTRLK